MRSRRAPHFYGRGHCHRISQIYYTYLDKWFSRALASDEHAAMQNVFSQLGNADDDLFVDLAISRGDVADRREGVLDLVVSGDKGAARARVLASMPALRPLRKTIARTMQTLYALKNEFADIAEVV